MPLSLYLTAGINKGQVEKLEAEGIKTMEALSRHEGRVPKLPTRTLEKLRTQARLQHARKTGGPAHELRSQETGKGFDLLPRPDPGDLFYDIEGDPLRPTTRSAKRSAGSSRKRVTKPPSPPAATKSSIQRSGWSRVSSKPGG